MKHKGIKVDSDQREKIKYMTRTLAFILIAGMVLSCRSTKKIQTAISKKDTAIRVALPGDKNYISNGKKNDTLLFIQNTLSQVDSNLIHFTTFSAKVNVDYRSGDGKNYNLNAT